MTMYTALFHDGTEIVKTSYEFKNRLDFYNWICREQLGKIHGELIAINEEA